MEIEVERLARHIVIRVDNAFDSVEHGGLAITLDEASILRDKLGRILHER